jgi:hypothetical protein
MSKNDPQKTEEAVDHAPAITQLQEQVAALEEGFLAATERADKAEAELAELGAMLESVPELINAAVAGKPVEALAKKAPVDLFDYAANPAGRYTLVPGKIMGKHLDHPFENYGFNEGKPQQADPSNDGWLRNQINAGFIVRWSPEVGEEHDQMILDAEEARQKQAKIDAGQAA